jgi:hypothetical protein
MSPEILAVVRWDILPLIVSLIPALSTSHNFFSTDRVYFSFFRINRYKSLFAPEFLCRQPERNGFLPVGRKGKKE